MSSPEALAAPPDISEEGQTMATARSETDTGEDALIVAEPDELDHTEQVPVRAARLEPVKPASEPLTDFGAKLIGTAVVEGGVSFAVFQQGAKSVLVREGNEIVEGLRLVQVSWNLIDVERDGVRHQIRIGSGEGLKVQRPRARREVRFLTNLPWRKK